MIVLVLNISYVETLPRNIILKFAFDCILLITCKGCIITNILCCNTLQFNCPLVLILVLKLFKITK